MMLDHCGGTVFCIRGVGGLLMPQLVCGVGQYTGVHNYSTDKET